MLQVHQAGKKLQCHCSGAFCIKLSYVPSSVTAHWPASCSNMASFCTEHCAGALSFRETTVLSASAHFCYTLPRCLQQRRIATTPFPRHTRVSAPSRSFTMCPPTPKQRPVPPFVRLCGAPSPIVVLPCTLLSPFLFAPSLIPVSADTVAQQVRVIVPPFRTHSLNTLLQSSSTLATPHRIARVCSVSSAILQPM
jgi:hypothetical protein